MPGRVSVASTEFVRNVGIWQEQALLTPVFITYHGRERLVLMSAERFGASAQARRGAGVDLGALSTAFVLENIAEAFFALSADLTLIALNRAAETYFGMSRRHIEGVSINSLFPSLAGTAFLNQIRRVMENREAAAFEAELAPAAGQRLEFKVFPLAQGAGVLFTNIAERERREQALHDASAVLAAIEASPAMALLKCDGRGRLIEVDQVFAAWMRFEHEALLGARLFDLVAAGDRRVFGDRFEECLVEGRAASVSVRIAGRDFDERALRLSLSPVRAKRAGEVRIICQQMHAETLGR